MSVQRPLRVALVWNNAILHEALVSEPGPVRFGTDGLHPLPEGMDDLELFDAGGAGFVLKTGPGLAGDIWLDGSRTPVASLRGETPIGPRDYGVITAGSVAVFFQPVKGALPPSRSRRSIDYGLVASLLLAVFLCATLGVIGYLDWLWRGDAEPSYELDEDLISRFLVTPPPESLLDELDGGTEMEDPGLRQREESGGERAADDEGRVGREDAQQEDSEFEGEVNDAIVQRVRNEGLLGALSGSEGNPLAAALDVPDIGDILGGTGAVATNLGMGSGGAGLRGLGMGGGGTGPGSLYGAGMVGTGIGAGRGGTGMGRGGIGARGRQTMEIRVAVMRGRQRVNGYLSAEQINRVVRANSAAVRYCYQNEVQ
ncbi:MAG: hypothetical protein AAF411_08990, partial [Myxococcota bacterium]